MQGKETNKNPGMEHPLEIRLTRLHEEELPQILAIERESHLEPWSGESFLEELGHSFSQILVAQVREPDDGRKARQAREGSVQAPRGNLSFRMAGYICFWCVADEIQILNVTVDKKWRRRGIARRLLHHVLELARESSAQSIVLELRKSNLPARMLYENLGFQVVGERPDYYGVIREPAILMEMCIGGKGPF
ncbi:MAG: ribosomal protein S18-alanine N-acetyltransferase [Deltaproteobacteria bacterium]|jgi:ribosomal-protein-alanine N-acetyltransferase|nr:ribosomal protein S18-alanine N-acetyltransferase [Deltaproteobacteria bacterium]